MSLVSELKLKSEDCILESLGILPKNQGEGLVSGFGSEQPVKQQSTPASFIGPTCSMVVL